MVCVLCLAPFSCARVGILARSGRRFAGFRETKGGALYAWYPQHFRESFPMGAKDSLRAFSKRPRSQWAVAICAPLLFLPGQRALRGRMILCFLYIHEFLAKQSLPQGFQYCVRSAGVSFSQPGMPGFLDGCVQIWAGARVGVR